MKNAILIFFLFVPFLLHAQVFPEIQELNSKDFLFVQYQQDVEESARELFREGKASTTFYSYYTKDKDTFFSIAARCCISQETLCTVNSIEDSLSLVPGMKLILPTVNGVFVAEEAKTGIDFLLKGRFASRISEGEGNEYIIDGKKFYFFSGEKFSSGERAFFLNPGMSLPLAKSTLTSEFGKRKSPITGKWSFHRGIDLASPLGSTVMSCKMGLVKKVTFGDSVYGNYIVIEHPNGIESLYAHLGEVLVTEGESVSTGQKIGKVGLTGLTTGPHLHFEVKQNGEALNPEKYLK